ncbi:MAG: hypothetical protein KJ015_16230 [Myxococcales bacterium]|nr:hypothetical protein [Myxococcales bacterium]
MHAFDRLLWRRCLGLSLLLSLLVAGVAAATDEPGSTLGMRLSRLAAFLPAVAVIAQQIVLAQCRARGELAALAALGASPLSQVRGAIVAGLSLGALAVAAVLSPLSDVSALFPVVGGASSFTPTDGGLWDPRSGVIYAPDGGVSFGAAAEPRSLAPPTRDVAVGFVAPLALVAPVWGAAPLGLGARGGGAFLAFALSVLLLHGVAAARAPALCLGLGALPLALQALIAFRSRRPG